MENVIKHIHCLFREKNHFNNCQLRTDFMNGLFGNTLLVDYLREGLNYVYDVL